MIQSLLRLSEAAHQAAIGYALMYAVSGDPEHYISYARELCLAIDLLERSREFVQIPQWCESENVCRPWSPKPYDTFVYMTEEEEAAFWEERRTLERDYTQLY